MVIKLANALLVAFLHFFHSIKCVFLPVNMHITICCTYLENNNTIRTQHIYYYTVIYAVFYRYLTNDKIKI